MNYSSDIMSYGNLRLEIAVLQHDIDAKNPGICKFKIPAILTNNNTGSIYTPTPTINKVVRKSSVAVTTFDNTIDIRVPKEYTMFCDVDIIPKGTRFIVAFIGGNINDMRIIGRYDYID